MFYSVHHDRITAVVCALIADPDPRKPQMGPEGLVTTAAAIVDEIARRGGDTAVLPAKRTETSKGQRFEAMA